MSIFIMFAPKKERRAEKEENGSGTKRWEYACGKACATHGTQEFTATGARVKRRAAAKKEDRKKCAGEPM